MNRATLRRGLVTVVRLALGALFVVAGALKLRDPSGFASAIANYQILPSLSPYLAAALPAAEIVAGLALMVAPVAWRRAGALVIALMMLAFTVAAAAALARGLNVDCGCFGSASEAVTGLTVVRDLLLVAAAVAVLITDRGPSVSAPGTAADASR